MYTIFTCTALGLVLAVILTPKEKRTAATIEPALAICLTAMISFLVGLAIAKFLSAALPEKQVVIGPQAIVSMRSAEGQAGTFILGTGRMGSERTYHYLLKAEDGSMVPHSVPANQFVHITEDTSLQNSGTVTVTRIKADRTSFLNNWSVFRHSQDRTVRIDFRVPVGTVAQRFSVH